MFFFNRFTLRRRLLFATLAGATFPILGISLQCQVPPHEVLLALQRGVYTLRITADIIRRYRSVDSAQWTELHEEAANLVYLLCSEQGGLYVKAAQLLCTTRVSSIPEPFLRHLSLLTDHAKSSEIQDVHVVMQRNLPPGHSVQEVFEFIDPIPLGSASLGQVHRARLRSDARIFAHAEQTGVAPVREVAVKVQHHRLRYEIPVDLLTLKVVANLVERSIPHSLPLNWFLQLIQEIIREELDFNFEARNSEWCRKTLCPLHEYVRVPKIYFSSHELLVMELVPGESIAHFFEQNTTAAKGKCLAGSERYHIADVLTKVYADMFFRFGRIHCDPHPGNIFYDTSTRLVYLLDHGMYRTLPEAFRSAHARLWYAMFTFNDQVIQSACEDLGIPQYTELVPLIFTQRAMGHYRRMTSASHIRQQFVVASAKIPHRVTREQEIALQVSKIASALKEIPEDFLIVMKVMLTLRGETNDLGYRGIVRQQAYAKAAKNAVSEELRRQGKILAAVCSEIRFWCCYCLFSTILR